jgi:hypothetical protein
VLIDLIFPWVLDLCTHNRTVLLERNDTRCPRAAFLLDLRQVVAEVLQQGEHIILMLDANSQLKQSDLQSALEALKLKQAIISRHGGPCYFSEKHIESSHGWYLGLARNSFGVFWLLRL